MYFDAARDSRCRSRATMDDMSAAVLSSRRAVSHNEKCVKWCVNVQRKTAAYAKRLRYSATLQFFCHLVQTGDEFGH